MTRRRRPGFTRGLAGAGRELSPRPSVAGTGLFLRLTALRRWPAPVAGARSSNPDAASGQAGAGRVILAVAFATGAIGLCLGGLGLVIVAFSQARHDPAAVAWIEAMLSAAPGGLAGNTLPPAAEAAGRDR